MIQSNMSCVALSTILMFQKTNGIFAALSLVLLIVDAILGSAIFVAQNKQAMLKQVQLVNKIQCPTDKIEKSINIAFKLSGNIIELGMGGQRPETQEYF